MTPALAARIAYGSLFTLAIPAALIAWSMRLDRITRLPTFAPTPIGWIFVVVGLALIVSSMLALWRIGGGLPMNAFPPPRLVRRGPYAVLGHPIYLGFIVVCGGTSLAFGSPSGVWIVTPIAAIGSIALVLGYEQHDLRRRFGTDATRGPLSLPESNNDPPSIRDRCAVSLRLFVPWLIGYELIGHLPVHGAIDTMSEVERLWPTWTWTTLVYSSGYLFVVLAPWWARDNRTLRRWTLDVGLAIVVGLLLFLIVPAVVEPRPFDPYGRFGWLLALERADGVGRNAAFPSFHVAWAVLAAALWSSRGATAALLAWFWATLITIACLTTGMHSITDVLAGVVLGFAALARSRLWTIAIGGAQQIANSWREWRIGRLRIINHGGYAALAAGVGVLLIASLAGTNRIGEIATIAIASLVGAGLWGQYWVGSRTLQRPFGYFGSVLGTSLAVVAFASLGRDPWALGAAVATAAPWVQAIGRLRCLVQGCCHGAPVDGLSESDGELPRGIAYLHERSRVCRIAHLRGVPVHPTPLYSIIANVVIGLLLARLWSLGASASLVLGSYLVFAAVARFVEESYRGEPQTPIIAGLRFYQWCAIVMLVAGAVISCIAAPAVPIATVPTGTTIAVALAIGCLYWFAMGVDFPESNRRFARLA